MIKQLILVTIGGGVGSALRYFTSVIVGKVQPYEFPLATLFVNLAGCLLIGILIGASGHYGWLNKELKLLLITGFCGGFTTFSTFSAESLAMLEAGNYGGLFLYVFGSVILGCFAVWLGVILFRL